MDQSQEFFHDLLVTLASQGEINLFYYLWYAPLKIIKERRSLFDSYVAALQNHRYKTTKFIWYLDQEWITKRDLWFDEYDRPINLFGLMKLKYKLIEAIEEISLDNFRQLINERRDLNETAMHEILSRSKIIDFVEKVEKIIGSVNHEEIVNLAIQSANFELVKDFEK